MSGFDVPNGYSLEYAETTYRLNSHCKAVAKADFLVEKELFHRFPLKLSKGLDSLHQSFDPITITNAHRS